MAHLTDMEELLASIEDASIRDYMSEAMSCYMAGAYRASVVLTFIAMFDDIFVKLSELSKVNSKAKAIFSAANKRRSEQDVFETYLIDQLRSNGLLSGLDADFLETLRALRNKAAHPSGHHSSAEEARFVFFEAITRFLSRPILSTTQLADELIDKLSNSNLFPSTSIHVVSKVVEQELEHLHPETYPYFVMKLIDIYRGPISQQKRNSHWFLDGLAKLKRPDLTSVLKKYLVEKLASDKSFIVILMTVISANPELFTELDEITYSRLAIVVGERISSIGDEIAHTKLSHPVYFFQSLVSDGLTDLVMLRLPKQLDALIERFAYSAYFAKKIEKKGPVFDKLIARFLVNARSNDFEVSNKLAENLAQIDKLLATFISADVAFELLANVIYAAKRGAYSAIDAENARFGASPRLLVKAKSYVTEEKDKALAVAGELFGEDSETLVKSLKTIID